MFFKESEPFRLLVWATLQSSRLYYLLAFLAGSTATVLATKGLKLVTDYLSERKAERLAIRKRFQDTKKGWLDYRVESERSSERLHVLITRMSKQMKKVAIPMMLGKPYLGNKPSMIRIHTGAHVFAYILNWCSSKLESDQQEFEATAELFIESTEGHLNSSRSDYNRLNLAHEYFKQQAAELGEATSVMPEFLKVFPQLRQVSQDLAVACDRQSMCWRSRTDVMIKLQKHCAKMAKLAAVRRDRAIDRKIIKPLKQMTSGLIGTVEMLAQKHDNDELREQAHHLREIEKQVEAGQQPDTTWIDQKHSEIEARLRSSSSSMISSSETPETRE